jgi:hypothetical protein
VMSSPRVRRARRHQPNRPTHRVARHQVEPPVRLTYIDQEEP